MLFFIKFINQTIPSQILTLDATIDKSFTTIGLVILVIVDVAVREEDRSRDKQRKKCDDSYNIKDNKD